MKKIKSKGTRTYGWIMIVCGVLINIAIFTSYYEDPLFIPALKVAVILIVVGFLVVVFDPE